MTKDPKDMTMEELEAQIAEDQEEEKKERQAHEAKMYTEGYRWYVDACIHPEAGGDDYLITLYFAEKPSNGDIEGTLKKQGSCLIDGQYTEPKELKDPNNKGESAMMTKEKLAKLNELRIANDMKPLKAWKQSVAKLDAAIEKLEPVEEEAPAVTAEDVAEASEAQAESAKSDPIADAMSEVLESETDENHVNLDSRFKTIREASEFMLRETDKETGEGLPYKYILRCVLACFPKAKTSIACLRWYANKMNQRGEIMPPRKSGNRKK